MELDEGHTKCGISLVTEIIVIVGVNNAQTSCLQENQVSQTVINYVRFEPQALERNQTVINYVRLEDFERGSPRRRR